MKQAKTEFKYPLTEKNSLKNIRNITFRCDDDMKESERALLAAGIDLAKHFRAAAREIFAEQKAQIEMRDKEQSA